MTSRDVTRNKWNLGFTVTADIAYRQANGEGKERGRSSLKERNKECRTGDNELAKRGAETGLSSSSAICCR